MTQRQIGDTFKITGFDELQHAFNAMTGTQLRAAGRATARAGAREVINEAKTRAPIRPGILGSSLFKSLNVKVKVYSLAELISGIAGPRSEKRVLGVNPAKYHHLVERGHRIVARGKKGKSNKGGTPIGYVPGTHYLETSLMTNPNATVAAMDAKFSKYVEKHFKKLAAKNAAIAAGA